MNRSSRKCCTYSYRGNEETFLDLSCKKSPLTTTKQLPKWIKWEESGKSLWYFERINPVSIVIYPLCWGSDTKGLVETRGVEPLTSTLPALRSTSWATSPKDGIGRMSRNLYPEFEKPIKFMFFWCGLSPESGEITLRKLASPRGVEPLLPPWKGGVLGR